MGSQGHGGGSILSRCRVSGHVWKLPVHPMLRRHEQHCNALQLLLGLPAIKRIVQVTMRLGGALTSRSKAMAVLRDREFQYGLKLWFTCASVLVGIVILQKDYARVRTWSPYFAFITIPIIFDMRVGSHSCFNPQPSTLRAWTLWDAFICAGYQSLPEICPWHQVFTWLSSDAPKAFSGLCQHAHHWLLTDTVLSFDSQQIAA